MSNLQDSRVKRGPGKIRESRALQSRDVTSNRELTDHERRDAFRQSFFQSHLPDLPKIEGFHVCWLTTANVQDPIHARLRYGYELLEADDFPGWGHVKSAPNSAFPGKIMVNEMIAAKLKLSLYQDYMREVHHDRPLEEAARIRNDAQEVVEGINRNARGARANIASGTVQMAKDPGVPDFGRLNGESGEPYEPHEMARLNQRRLSRGDEVDEDEGESL
jgi:hypothetical protein